MATLNSRQYINIQCTTYRQIQYTIEQIESSANAEVFSYIVPFQLPESGHLV